MALAMRLRQMGKTNRHTFRIVVTDRRAKRDGKYKEMIGWYNPHEKDGKNIFVDAEKAWYWIDNGAVISDNVKSLVKRAAPEVITKLNEKILKKKLKKVKKKALAKTKAKKASKK